MRLFVGIEISAAGREAILGVRERLVSLVARQGVRFVNPEKLHLTLAFLGNVDPKDLESLKAALSAVPKVCEVTLDLISIGAFPDMRRPKVVWIGLEGDLRSLAILAGNVTHAAKPFAPQLDEKPFSPHITLARINPGSKEVGRVLAQAHIEPPAAKMVVDSFVLFHSRPDGAYEILHRVAL